MPKMPSKPSSRSTSSVEARLRRDAVSIFNAALAAADPYAVTLAHLPKGLNNIYVVGAGKAAAAMARAVEKAYGNKIKDGVVVTKYGHTQPLKQIRCREASHPVPDEAGVAAAQEIAQLCLSAGESDHILCLISGGASALLPFPAQSITLEEKQQTTKLLLASGATINELNCVRKHLSAIKGGHLAELAFPARVHTLILSDVIGDPLDVIGSGPTVPDSSTFEQAWKILYHHGLTNKVPASVRGHIEQGVNQATPETPKPGDKVFDRVTNTLIGSNRQSLQAAQSAAQKLGYQPVLLSTSLDGEARETAKFFAAMAREIAATGNPAPRPVALLAGGETTVTLTQRHGLGGRNQEMALAAAIGIAGLESTLFLAAGTDGTDGPTNAAGAFATGQTLARAQALELDPQDFLTRNDSHHFFQPLNDLLITGPTGTNVMDLYLALLR